MPGVVCPVPGGAFYVVAHLPVDDAEVSASGCWKSFPMKTRP